MDELAAVVERKVSSACQNLTAELIVAGGDMQNEGGRRILRIELNNHVYSTAW